MSDPKDLQDQALDNRSKIEAKVDKFTRRHVETLANLATGGYLFVVFLVVASVLFFIIQLVLSFPLNLP